MRFSNARSYAKRFSRGFIQWNNRTKESFQRPCSGEYVAGRIRYLTIVFPLSRLQFHPGLQDSPADRPAVRDSKWMH